MPLNRQTRKRNPWYSATIRVSLQVDRLSHWCQSFFTRITAEYHGTDIILRKLRNAVESRNKKRNPWCSVTIRVSLQVDRFSHRYPSFFTRITAEYHGTNVILGKLRNAVESTNEKRNPWCSVTIRVRILNFKKLNWINKVDFLVIPYKLINFAHWNTLPQSSPPHRTENQESKQQ